MAEVCDHCGGPMADWSATHCSEHCLLESIKNSITLTANSKYDAILAKMREQNRFDRKAFDGLE